MIPAGYLYKRVVARPEWLNAPHVENVYSLSSCISDNFADAVQFWRRNGYWLFDTPDVMEAIAAAESIDLSRHALFYYEFHELEFDERQRRWWPFDPIPHTWTHVLAPRRKDLRGFDVTGFSARTAPECSPLSCNGLASELPVNRHCLLETLDEARDALERGAFDNTEPGPFRIVAVYTVPAGDP
jgi:hypothetical protein